MTSSVDLFPPRRPLFFPVVIATVFLTIIGMAGGYVLGERHRRDAAQPEPSSTQPIGPAAASSAPTDGGPDCPPPAQAAYAAMGFPGTLRQIFMVETDNQSTVWICQDPAGSLYYQSHTLLDGQDLPLQQNKNGLFLAGVTRTDDGFEAVDQKNNHFEISRTRFQIRFASGKVQSNDVVKVEG